MIFNGTTVAFSTKANVWKTRYSFTPSCYMTMDNDFLSSNRLGDMTNEILYKHDVNSTHNSFYGGASVPSTIEVVSNQNPSAVKIFKALSLETDAKVWNGSVYTNKTRDTYAYQEGNLNPFVQKEGNQYVDMPRSATNSSSNITFVGTIDISNLEYNDFFSALNDNFNLIVQLNNIPDVNMPIGEGSVVFFGNPATTLIDPISLETQRIDQGFPEGDVIDVVRYDESSNTLMLRFFNNTSIAASINWLISSYGVGQSGGNEVNAAKIPIYIMTSPVLDGDNMRGPYAGIKLTSPNSHSAFELYSINVDYEKTKLDGSLG
tara:strand:- start:53 stop:1009 length:957 start_codon:yes stop_codon:yes gene_type:complete